MCVCVCARMFVCLCVFVRVYAGIEPASRQKGQRRPSAETPTRRAVRVDRVWGSLRGPVCCEAHTRRAGMHSPRPREPSGSSLAVSPPPRRRGALRVFPAPRPRWARSGRSACGTTAAGPRPPGTSAAWWWESCPRAQGGAGSSPPSAGWPRTGRTAVWRGSSPACAGASASGR